MQNYCYRLKSMPGIDTVTSCDLIAQIGDIHRCMNPSIVAKFAGISPVNFCSAGKGKDKVSKQGNRKLNGVFYILAGEQVVSLKKYYNRKESSLLQQVPKVDC